MPDMQLGIFPSDKKSILPDDTELTIFVDGASRNNPGPAGIGVVITAPEAYVDQMGYYIGLKTNNQAEYLAIVYALWFIMNKAGSDPMRINIFADSELVVKQLNGLYRVRNQQLKPLYLAAQELMQQCQVHIAHVLRAQNSAADAMANKGIDEKRALPEAFKSFLQKSNIAL